MSSRSGTISSAATTTRTPCSIVEFRLTAPAFTFAELRTATPATGSPPRPPETMLAAPCPSSSRSRPERPTSAGGPGRAATSLSTATAPSSDCTLHTRVVVSTAATMPSTGPSGSPASAWLLQDGRSTLGSFSAASEAAAVAPVTAIRAAGILRRSCPARPGTRGQSSSKARVSALTETAAGCISANWAGRARRLSGTELCGVPPRTMCSWATAMVTPMPASMPCTMAGLTASALRATRRHPRPSWTTPARTVMAQVVRHP